MSPIASPLCSASPSSKDVKRQLKKMMGSLVFSLRPMQGKMLAFLVRGELAGKELTNKFVLENVYTRSDMSASNAKETINWVRKRLDEYYATDGKEDLVIIALPRSPKGKRIKFAAGDAYRPRFSYNPHHIAMKEYQLGAYYSRRGGPTDLAVAQEHYTKAIAIHPRHADALIGMVWVFLGSAWSSSGEEKLIHLASAKRYSDAVLKVSPHYWGSHFAHASVLAEDNNLEEARRAYDRSFDLNQKSTEACARRTPLLRMLGGKHKHLRLAEDHLYERPSDPEAYVIKGTALMTLRRFDDAIEAARGALKLDRNFLTAHFLVAACLIHKQKLSEAETHIDRMKALSDHPTFTKLEGLLRYMIIRTSRDG